MSEPSHAVFLSYASQDREAAQRICEALRAAGIEVFLDQSELRGGDVWDQRIRREIHDCALFMPLISANTASRHEGYFRLEWDLADQRTHMIARNRVFIVPVCLDATSEAGADVPESFQRVQWTHLPSGPTPPEFVARIKRLLSPAPPMSPPITGPSASAGSGSPPLPSRTGRLGPPRRFLPVALVVILVALAALAYLLADKPRSAGRGPPAATSNRLTTTAPAATDTVATFNPPPHSIAVLPFVNLSGDQEQEYFSDGLTEELLNSLAEINQLQVAARTSSFSFKEHPDIATVAHKLNVATVLEGSVRRSAHKVRITAQLINAVTGFHMWSKTYDLDLGYGLKLQTEIASAVASALKITLLGDLGAKIELGGTRNPAALDAYLRASRAYLAYDREADVQAAVAGYSEAIRQDPNYALAFAYRALALASYARNYSTGAAIHERDEKAQSDAHKALELAPELAEAHEALATILRDSLEFGRAAEEFQRAVALAPGNARILGDYGVFAAETGQTEAGVAAARKAVVLDPLSADANTSLGFALTAARRFPEAITAFMHAKELAPSYAFTNSWLSFNYLATGDVPRAHAACDLADESNKPICSAVVYDKLGRHAEARQALSQLQAESGDAAAVFYAMIYAQWGDTAHALVWLETAMRHRDPYLLRVRQGQLLDPLRNEPRFQAIQRELKFPN
ncbi:MAG: TIR domain-containing protein [Steroidobacteraceae bacterium]